MDAVDRRIVDALQGGFPICPRPYAAAAQRIGLSEDELIARLAALSAGGTISRFGPLWDVERLGGAVTLAAIAVPAERFDDVAALVNAHPEVAHNYAREHALNMWFVVSAESRAEIDRVLAAIAAETGLEVLDMPKSEEYFLGLRLAA
ncbi:MAG: Lrp/AsnC family transcriptional regulator [Alphaproteobacteria bacterium]|nr:Lrp/AsnC family transcriptional regulator [Alphaproteobacteria bacterium]